MSATNLVLVFVSLIFAALFMNPRLRNAPLWRATVTPLASIIGSGFLIAGPILAHAAGTKAWIAMAALCGVAYLFGFAMRANIAHVQAEHAASSSRAATALKRASELSLSFAYFISVAYYLNLFSAFGLRFWAITDPLAIRIGETAIIVIVGALGATGGLKALERLEVGAVGLKLSVIGGLIAALALSNALAAGAGGFEWRAPMHSRGFDEIRVVLGLLILVQGFETSRYLGAEYDAATRIRTMRWAQWLSTGVYVTFILLITRYFNSGLPAEGGETAIIDMLAPIGAAVAPLVILAALASQLSAAVADMNGAGGLLAEASGGRMPVRAGNLITALVALAIVWAANIYEIIAYASKAFVVYYGLQSAQAALSAFRRRRRALAALFSICVIIALIILVFAKPAEA